jgi:hypothetical protein
MSFRWFMSGTVWTVNFEIASLGPGGCRGNQRPCGRCRVLAPKTRACRPEGERGRHKDEGVLREHGRRASQAHRRTVRRGSEGAAGVYVDGAP